MTIKLIPLLDTLHLEKISDEEYFSQKYANYISNSRLGLVNPDQGGNYKKFFSGNSNIFSDSILWGSAVHELVLQPDQFFLCFDVDRPSAKAGYMADELFPYYKTNNINCSTIADAVTKVDYYKNSFDERKLDALLAKCTPYWKARATYEKDFPNDKTPIYLDPRGRERVQNCVHALQRNTKIQTLLHPVGLFENPITENEQAILLDIRVDYPGKKPFILKLKAKLDNYTIDKENNVICVNDIKTIGKIIPEFPNNFNQYHYYRELAIYCWLLSLCATKFYDMKDFMIQSNCLVVSTIPGYYTKVFPVTKADLVKGWNEFKLLFTLVASAVATEYPDFGIWI